MIWFAICAVLLVLGVLALLLPPLLPGRRVAASSPALPTATSSTSTTSSLAILREQAAQLEAEKNQGLLAADQYEAARQELAARTLEEVDGIPQTLSPASATPRPWASVAAVSLLVPVMAVVLYARLGTPGALNAAPAAASADGGVTQAQVEAMVAAMAARLDSLPPGQSDPEGWAMLARSMAALQRYPEADRAYARAIEAAPRNAQLLADRADLLAMLQGGKSAGEPTRLVEKALQIDPGNLKALALAGSAAFEREDFAAAISLWQRARALAPAGSEFASDVDRSLEAARNSAAQMAAGPARSITPAAGPLGASNERAAVAAAPSGPGASVSGVVRLAPALASRLGKGDTLFVFARAAQGPRMPLAILRLQASALPASFTLDDQLAMSPEMRLSRFPEVVVSARISRSGEALPQPGDLVGQTGPVKLGAKALELTIDQVQP